MPAGNKAATWKDQDNYWRSYVTFMLGMGKLDQAWQVEKIMLSAFVTNLVAFGSVIVYQNYDRVRDISGKHEE